MKEILLYSEINIICILIVGMLTLRAKDSIFSEAQKILFRMLGVSTILLFVSDILWISDIGSLFGKIRLVSTWMNAIYYICLTLCSYFWFLYSENIQWIYEKKATKFLLISFIPIAILLALSLLSVKTGWLFYVGENNEYHRGWLYPLHPMINYGYILFTSGKALYFSKKTKNYQQSQVYRMLAHFVIMPVLAGMIQVFTSKVPVLCVGITLGILNMYVGLQEQLISRDPLTQLNNRNVFRQYISLRLGKYGGRKPLYLLIIDGNCFKQINDGYGHIEGDHALKEIALALQRACRGKHDFICRFGGDEFIVLAEPENGDSVEALCERIHRELKRADTVYPLTVSIGYAKYNPNIKTAQQFIDLADKELYKDKEKRKQKR